ncbi:hypothetical protein HOLleu_20030 [Holothuria leucospilota]|uniref:Uncharacterized protein n=1 Tax=Holothuria leucospilota TaxID=206669 RepID=A0A9Q1C0G5_HOLLE|nr:hypothetical protein HOLleu_20030 [Holothuria leucospilota]
MSDSTGTHAVSLETKVAWDRVGLPPPYLFHINFSTFSKCGTNNEILEGKDKSDCDDSFAPSGSDDSQGERYA